MINSSQVYTVRGCSFPSLYSYTSFCYLLAHLERKHALREESPSVAMCAVAMCASRRIKRLFMYSKVNISWYYQVSTPCSSLSVVAPPSFPFPLKDSDSNTPH